MEYSCHYSNNTVQHLPNAGPPQSWDAAAHSTALALLQPFITQEGVRASDPTGRGALGKYEEGGEDRGHGGRMETVTFDMRPQDVRKSLRCNT